MIEKFLSPFQIGGTTVRSFSIKNDLLAVDHDDKLKRKLDMSHSISNVDVLGNDDLYSGSVILNIKAVVSKEKLKYQLSLSIEGFFVGRKDSMDENKFAEMLRINGLSSLYSIARGFIQNTTAQTVLDGSILLPMMNIVEYSKEIEPKG